MYLDAFWHYHTMIQYHAHNHHILSARYVQPTPYDIIRHTISHERSEKIDQRDLFEFGAESSVVSQLLQTLRK
jgi:hypothetical protein